MMSNTKDEALKMAQDYLTDHQIGVHIITAIKQALLTATPLAAPVQQSRSDVEPVAWMFEFPDKRVKPKFDSAPHGGKWQPLYIQPPPDAYGYAKRLAVAIWKKHYQFTAPQWEPFDDLMGVLTQIDNMTSGLTTPQPCPTCESLARAVMMDQTAHDTHNAAPAPEERKRQWVGLTNKEIEFLCYADGALRQRTATEMAFAVESKLREKNT
jgi:hypothetical protein